MVEAGKSLFLILSALFPIVDPLGGSPIFLAMTKEYSPSTRRALSWRIAMNSFFLLVGSYFIGTHILSFFGISLPVVQVGGGLIVISTGWTLLKQGNDDDRDEHKEAKKRNLQPKDPFRNAFYPLTLPLTVGPGSISVAITLGANAPHHQGFNLVIVLTAIVGSVLLAASIFLCYGFPPHSPDGADRVGTRPTPPLVQANSRRFRARASLASRIFNSLRNRAVRNSRTWISNREARPSLAPAPLAPTRSPAPPPCSSSRDTIARPACPAVLFAAIL